MVNPEVIVKIHGGLGNQMFQWAFGKAFSQRSGQEVYFDNYAYRIKGYDRTFGLQNFNAEVNLKRRREKKRNIFYNFFVKPHFKKDKIEEVIIDKCVVEQANLKFDESLLCLESPVYIEGFFQSEKYFADIADQIKRGFSLKTPLNQNNLDMLEKIKNSNAISLHVRRGDYLNDEDDWGICSKKYYQMAVELIVKEANITNPSLFIFSDDYQWVSENLKFDCEMFFVNINGPDEAYFDLELMKNCKHNVIANSSFSWWGAWLNENSQKIVVAPKPWFKNLEKEHDIVPQDWLRLEAF